MLSNGKYVVVMFVQHEILESPVKVYNFEVANNHNYYVAESIFVSADCFVLVHNKCGFDSKSYHVGDVGAKYKDVRIDVEMGGAGPNMHIQSSSWQGSYYWNGKIFDGAPNVINKSNKVANVMNKAIKYFLYLGGK